MPDSIRILDGEQGDAIADVIRRGIRERLDQIQQVNQTEFYFRYFYEKTGGEGSPRKGGSGDDSGG